MNPLRWAGRPIGERMDPAPAASTTRPAWLVPLLDRLRVRPPLGLYEALAKGAGIGLIVVAFLGGIPPPAWIARQMQTQMRISAARRAEAGIPTPTTGVQLAQSGVGCILAALSVLAGLFAGLDLFTSGSYHRWIYPEIALVLLLPALDLPRRVGGPPNSLNGLTRSLPHDRERFGLDLASGVTRLGWLCHLPYFVRPPGAP